jgi:hypothetical protein
MARKWHKSVWAQLHALSDAQLARLLVRLESKRRRVAVIRAQRRQQSGNRMALN